MTADNLARFRLMCRQFRALAIFMVVSVGGLLALAPVAFFLAQGDRPVRLLVEQVLWALPALFYLFAVWSIGSAMGQLAKGRLIQPTLSSALRRVGLALGLGGVLSVFGVTNLMRLLGLTQGGFAFFAIAGMTLGMIGRALFLLGRVIDHAGRIQAEMDEMI